MLITNNLQWIKSLDYQNENRYIFGKIDYNEFRFVFRLNVNLTPNFTIQYYGQPFVGAGEYSKFKRITNPRAGKSENRYALLNEIKHENEYQIDENQDDVIHSFGPFVVGPNSTLTKRFDVPITYEGACTFHQEQQMRLVVNPAPWNVFN